MLFKNCDLEPRHSPPAHLLPQVPPRAHRPLVHGNRPETTTPASRLWGCAVTEPYTLLLASLLTQLLRRLLHLYLCQTGICAGTLGPFVPTQTHPPRAPRQPGQPRSSEVSLMGVVWCIRRQAKLIRLGDLAARVYPSIPCSAAASKQTHTPHVLSSRRRR